MNNSKKTRSEEFITEVKGNIFHLFMLFYFGTISLIIASFSLYLEIIKSNTNYYYVSLIFGLVFVVTYYYIFVEFFAFFLAHAIKNFQLHSKAYAYAAFTFFSVFVLGGIYYWQGWEGIFVLLGTGLLMVLGGIITPYIVNNFKNTKIGKKLDKAFINKHDESPARFS